MADFVIAARLARRRVLQPIERALAGQRRAILPLPLQPIRQQRQGGIVAQLVVIVDILVAESDPADPLPEQRPKPVHHQFRRPMIDEAIRHTIEQTDRRSAMTQQQGPGIATDRPAIEGRHHATAIEGFKFELIGDTLCRHRTSSWNLLSLCHKRTLQHS